MSYLLQVRASRNDAGCRSVYSNGTMRSAWRRKPVVLFALLAITVLFLVVHYSQNGAYPEVPRLLDNRVEVCL